MHNLQQEQIKTQFAERTLRMSASAIREILKVVQQPGMVSLAGGIPAPESFPMDIMKELVNRVIDKYSSFAFQYDRTEGFIPLVEVLAEYVKRRNIMISANQIIIGSGSQSFLDGIGKIFINKGTKIAVEAPTYLGAIQAFNPYEPDYIKISTDDYGLIPEDLEIAIQKNDIRFLYLVPNFQNPTGKTIPAERRVRIAELITKNNIFLIEDDPYCDLRYTGEGLLPMKALIPDHVVYIGSLSKILAPGLRIGFCIAPPEIQRWLVLAKQGVDLHTSTFNQAIAAEYLREGYVDNQIPKIIELYKPKRDAMLTALEEYMPSGYSWSKPEGGMFVWLKAPMEIDMEAVNDLCIQKHVAFVPGKYFFTDRNEGLETARLNFTMSDINTIKKAICILSDVVKQYKY